MSSTACPPRGDHPDGEARGPGQLARRTYTATLRGTRGRAPPTGPASSRPAPAPGGPQNSPWRPAMHPSLIILSDLAASALTQPVAAPKTIPQVIDGITGWIMGIIAIVATMFLVIGGLRYMAAGGDPAQ